MQEKTTISDLELSETDLSGPNVGRRTMLRVLGVGGMAALAGCASDSGTDGGASNNSSSEQTSGSDRSSQASGSNNSAQNSSSNNSTDRYGGRVAIGLGRKETGKLNFAYITSIDMARILTNVSNGLVKLKPDLTLTGDIAKDWTVENEGTQYVFQLREGVKFHNGEEVTADDFKYTISRNIDKGYSSALNQLEGYIKPIDDDGVVVRDDYTLEMNWKKPIAFALATLTRGGYPAANVISKQAVEKMGKKDFGLKPVGTGPFKIAEHSVNSSIKLDRFEDYFDSDNNGNRLPYLDGIDVQLIPEQASLGNALVNGEVDFLMAADADILRRIKKNNNLDVRKKPDLMFRAVGFNQGNKLLQNEKFRMAIAKGIDNKALIQKVFSGTGVTSYGPYTPAFEWLQRDDVPTEQNHDLEGAQNLLKEVGAEGTSLTWTCYPAKQRMGRVLRQQLDKIGITIEVNALPPSQYNTAIENGEWDLQPLASYGETDPGLFLQKLFTPEGARSFQSTYGNEEVTQLIEKQSSIRDKDKRKEVLWEIEDKLHNTAAAAFVTHRYDLAMHNKELKNFKIYGSNRYMGRAWLQENA